MLNTIRGFILFYNVRCYSFLERCKKRSHYVTLNFSPPKHFTMIVTFFLQLSSIITLTKIFAFFSSYLNSMLFSACLFIDFVFGFSIPFGIEFSLGQRVLFLVLYTNQQRLGSFHHLSSIFLCFIISIRISLVVCLLLLILIPQIDLIKEEIIHVTRAYCDVCCYY